MLVEYKEEMLIDTMNLLDILTGVHLFEDVPIRTLRDLLLAA